MGELSTAKIIGIVLLVIVALFLITGILWSVMWWLVQIVAIVTIVFFIWRFLSSKFRS